MNPLKAGKGKVTKAGAALAALGVVIENIVALLQGEDLLNVAEALQGTYGAGMGLVGALLALWGGLRAAINYGEGKAGRLPVVLLLLGLSCLLLPSCALPLGDDGSTVRSQFGYYAPAVPGDPGAKLGVFTAVERPGAKTVLAE